MKKLILNILMLLPFAAMAQTEVTPYAPGTNAEGVTYLLPRTVLLVDIEVETAKYTPGEYAKYADRYLRMKNDIGTEPKTTCKIQNIHLDAAGAPDTSKVYTIKLKDKTIAPMIRLNEQGILQAINTDPKPSIPFEGYKASKSGKVYNSRDFMTEEILMAGSTAKSAELCAQEIYAIRESKNNLNRGQADYNPTDGKQMEIMINNLNEQEAALMQLFAGYTTYETKAYTFYVDPKEDIEKQILFRFSQRLGVVDNDDLSGAPVYISVKDQHTVTEPVIDEKKKKVKLEGIQYNIPSKAAIRIFDASNKSLLQGEVSVAQFGNVETLSGALFNKKTTTKVVFYDQTGAIMKIEE